MSEQLVEAIADVKEDTALALAKKMLEDGGDPLVMLEQCRKGMEIVGQRFGEGIYFIPELMMAGEILAQISAIAKSKMAGSDIAQPERLGKVVLGTVAGDIHDIGKNIVHFMLDFNGFEVIDIGVDQPPERFVEAVKEHSPQVVGLCGLLTLAYDPMKETVAALAEAGLRDKVKIMIGGGAMDDQVREYSGADAYGDDAVAAVTLTREWVGGAN